MAHLSHSDLRAAITKGIAAIDALAATVADGSFGSYHYVVECQGFYVNIVHGVPHMVGVCSAQRFHLARARSVAASIVNGNSQHGNAIDLALALNIERTHLLVILADIPEEG